MGDVGLWELVVIAVVGLVVFGPDRLPEVARKGARLVARVREQASGALDELREAADIDDLEREYKAVSADMRRMRDAARDPIRSALDQSQRPRGDDDVPPIDLEAT